MGLISFLVSLIQVGTHSLLRIPVAMGSNEQIIEDHPLADIAWIMVLASIVCAPFLISHSKVEF
jgi:hypothetical protein